MTTEIIKISDPHTKEGRLALARAAEILRRGGLVIFPTETVYGLGADATDEKAAERIYTAKGRPSDNPLIVHVADPNDARLYTEAPAVFDLLAAHFMPGPLTVVMPAKSTVPKTVTAGLPTVAIRCPSHPVANALIRAAGIPIAAPSANLSGTPSPTCAAHVADDMTGRVDMILDGGDCEIGLESTIVKIEDDGTLTLLRPGAITAEMLEAVVPELRIADAVLGQLAPGATVLSPGMKYRHYAPSAPLYILDGTTEQCAAFLKQEEGKIAVLCYDEQLPLFCSILSPGDCYSLGARDDRGMQAHRLFSLLREIDKASYRVIYAPLPPPQGIGMALYNRMIRAAAHHILHL